MNTTQSTTLRLNKGYTLLFAVLTASLVLGVAIFILSVSKKQLELTVAARESMYAFYAADTGIECASDTNLATSTYDTASGTYVENQISISCNGFSSPPVGWSTTIVGNFSFNPGTAYQVANIPISLPNGTCASITLTDGEITTGSVTSYVTYVDSRGYNNCNVNGTPKVSSRTVERALRLTFEH